MNAVLEDAYFTTLEHYNGLLTLNISVATMDVVTRKWSDSRIMKSNLIPILPVNDAPNITIDRMNSNMTSSDDNQEQDNKVTCNSNSTCSVSIILQDVDIDEFFSPLEFDKYFKVQGPLQSQKIEILMNNIDYKIWTSPQNISHMHRS